MKKIIPYIFTALIIQSYFISLGNTKENSGFQTPTGNIVCSIQNSILRCDLLENIAHVPKKPKDCEWDWGSSFAMKAKGKPYRLCVSDAIQEEFILEYGKSWKSQGFECISKAAGLTCTNQDKKGWFLKKSEQKIF